METLKNLENCNNKASVLFKSNGDEILFSYDTKVLTKKKNGNLIRHWAGDTKTTCVHVKRFCGLGRQDFLKMPVKK